MREFRFIYIHPADFPQRFAAWEDGQVPSSVPSFRTIEFKLFHWDYFEAYKTADALYIDWCYRNGYSGRNSHNPRSYGEN